MAALTKLIQTRAVYERFAGGSGLEKGEIYSFVPCPSNNSVPFPTIGSNCSTCSAFCFQSPGYGTAIIEIWGAGGSGTKAACCSFTVPGNPGAYSRKTVCMEYCGYVCGCVGHSCGDQGHGCSGNFTCKACSCPTAICWHSGANRCTGCMCAMGGRGGWSLCQSTSNSGYCCFLACCLVGSQPTCITGIGCGLICNYSSCATDGASCAAEGPTGNAFNPCRWMACAYGGDVNCCGGFSCTLFLHCNACCWCCRINYLAMPYNMFTEKQSILEVKVARNEGETSAAYHGPLMNSIVGLTRSPTHAMPVMYCFQGGQNCACYEMSGCISYVGVGIPGIGGLPCNTNICSMGMRGGSGGVRITWLAADKQSFDYVGNRVRLYDHEG